MKENKIIRLELIKIYGAICMLNGKVSLQNPLTLHHIVPVRQSGPTSIENGALLSQLRHNQFNLIEHYDPKTAEEINAFLIYYKKYRDELERKIMGDFIEQKVKQIKRWTC